MIQQIEHFSLNKQITKNIKASEYFFHEGLELKDITDELIFNAYQLCNALQVLRDMFDAPILITSGYRSVAYNQVVGGALCSYHTKALAADIVFKGINPIDVAHRLEFWGGGMGVSHAFTHLDLGAKRRWTY